jgi:hypothetical protein
MEPGRGLLRVQLLVLGGIWWGAATTVSAQATSCSGCWARGPGAALPAGKDPEYFPGKATGEHTCPGDAPFVSGDTTSCGCMDAYHNKVCSQDKCCRAVYECYGNCGDYTALYIFLAVGSGLIAMIGLARKYSGIAAGVTASQAAAKTGIAEPIVGEDGASGQARTVTP